MKKSLVLFEDEGFVDLLPLVFWRSIFELQVSRKLVMDRTAQRLGLPVAGVWTRDWLAPVVAHRCGAPVNQPAKAGTVLVNGRWLVEGPVKFPKPPCVGMVDSDVAYVVCDAKLSTRLSAADMLDAARRHTALEGVPREPADGRFFRHAWDIVAELPTLLADDWKPGDACIESPLDPKLELSNRERIHIGEQTEIHPTAIINAKAGSVYIGHDVHIGAYVVIEGPVYIGPGCRVFPFTRLHGGNSIGPVCKIAGEIVGSLLQSYTNKQHAGFLGHAYVGSWVNLGAGSTNSNLKNTYGPVRVPVNGKEVDSGRQFFGAIIADHAKIGINATIPTGAVIGLASSVASTRLLPKYIPSFSWVTEEGVRRGDPMRLVDAASAAMARRNMDMTDEEVELFIDLGTRVRSYEAPARQ